MDGDIMKISFGLYGSGWRSEFFLRVAKLLPERFEIVGIVTRNKEKAAFFSQTFGVKCYETADRLLSVATPDFIVVSVNASVNVDITLDLLNKNIPVLLETPPAANLDTLIRFHKSLPTGARIQIAEQYPFQPMHLARSAFLETGKLGRIQHAQISYTHGFHAIALIRHFLGIGFENAEITATTFPTSVVCGYTREGEPTEETIAEKMQTVAVLKFGNKTGLLNFETDQHRSWVRSPIIQIKGERGEVFNSKIKYLQDYKTPIESEFTRKDLGREENFEGFDLKGVIGDGQWLYRNPYQGSRFSDDEIAVASCLDAMNDYVHGGASFYGLNEASQDFYLAALIDEAAKNGCTLRSETQPWAN